MNNDINVIIDGCKLNIRTGVIIKYNNKVLVELSKIGGHSTIPGGRIHINEKSDDAAVRELREEIELSIDKNRLRHKKTIENFFVYEGFNYHEIYFIYEYDLNDIEATQLGNKKDNADNKKTYFEFIDLENIDKVNILPKILLDIINE